MTDNDGDFRGLVGATVASAEPGYGLWQLTFTDGRTLEVSFSHGDGCDPFFDIKVIAAPS